jgi:hypothetical protein
VVTDASVPLATPHVRLPDPANTPPREPPPETPAHDEPTPQRPVVAWAELRPARVRPGETLTFLVHVKTAPAWHLYAAEGPTGIGLPTTVQVQLPEGLEAAGAWTYPPAKTSSTGPGLIYEGALTFQKLLRVGAHAASGTLRLSCQLGYQACDPFCCRPPATLEVRAAGEVIPAP